MCDDNLDDDNLDSFDAEGVVTLRGVPGQMARPPSSYALVDPNQRLPLLQVVLKRPPGAIVVAGDWQRLKVWMWGVWHDRANEQIQKGDTVRIVAGLLEADPDAQPGEYGFRLVLPPRGAAEDTSLHITGPRGPDHTSEATITERRLATSRTANSASLLALGAAAAGPAAAGQGKKRARDNKKAREYSYLQIRALPERSSAAQQDLCFFGVVSDYTLPCATLGTDMKSTLHLVDETCSAPGQQLVLNFFKAHPKPPGVGAVLRFHRVSAEGEVDGVRHAKAIHARGQTLTHWVVGDLGEGGEGGEGAKSSEAVTWLASDSSRVAQLQAWGRGALSGSSLGGFRVPPLSLAQAMAAAAASGHSGHVDSIDLLVRLGPMLSRAEEAAAAPRQHGLGGSAEQLALCPLHDAATAAATAAAAAAPTAASGQGQGAPLLQAAAAALLLDSAMSPLPAQLLLAHLRATSLASQLASANAAPQRNDKFSADFGGGWVRLRNVRLQPCRPHASHGGVAASGMIVVFGARSSAQRLPGWHAAVTRLAGPAAAPPAAHPLGSPDAISSFASSVEDPISAFSSPGNSQANAGTPTAAPSAGAPPPLFARAPGQQACKYGLGCYRKHLAHWRAFDHPANHPFLSTPAAEASSSAPPCHDAGRPSPPLLID